tara:strand:+ start:260 stop:709 length:450 start_codon:yes stop_codon:yes gene_type:complete
MKKTWGPPTWLFLHCFAEHINKDFFIQNRGHCLNIIRQICNQIPCNYCKQNALNFIKYNRLENIKTKEDMKNYLFKFHNHANVASNSKNVAIDVLKKYKHINFFNSALFFYNRFNTRSVTTKLFMNQFTRKNTLISIMNWIKHNKRGFE